MIVADVSGKSPRHHGSNLRWSGLHPLPHPDPHHFLDSCRHQGELLNPPPCGLPSGLGQCHNKPYQNRNITLGRLKRFDAIASKCQFVSIDLCEIIKPLEGGPEGFNAKYFVRNVFTAKPGKRSELIDVLVEQRESLTPGSPKANILKSLSSWDKIRSARSFDSYQALAESLTQIESPANRSGWGRVVNLTDQMTRTISKIQYIM